MDHVRQIPSPDIWTISRIKVATIGGGGNVDNIGVHTLVEIVRPGTTVETAIRVLRRFERSGWIEGGVGWIRILDREALQSVASGDASEG